MIFSSISVGLQLKQYVWKQNQIEKNNLTKLQWNMRYSADERVTVNLVFAYGKWSSADL